MQDPLQSSCRQRAPPYAGGKEIIPTYFACAWQAPGCTIMVCKYKEVVCLKMRYKALVGILILIIVALLMVILLQQCGGSARLRGQEAAYTRNSQAEDIRSQVHKKAASAI